MNLRAAKPTLGQSLSGRDNALNFVRLVLASLVILDHAPSDGARPFESIGGIGLGMWAVGGFFAISGYLIAGSRVRLDFLAFLWRRIIRIFPAFWVCLIAVAFFFAPASTLLTGRTWHFESALSYVFANAGLVITQWTVEDTFPPGAFRSWNGSLWTLAYEFAAYLCVGLILTFAVVKRHSTAWFAALLGIASASLWCIVSVWPHLPQAITDIPGHTGYVLMVDTLQLATYFLAGSLAWSLRNTVSVSWAWLTIALIGTVVVCLFGLAQFLAAPFLAYIVLSLGALLPIRLGSVNDISYGVYIYGMPVQRMLIFAWGTTGGPFLNALLALIIVIPIAYLSWKFIEKPALNYARLLDGVLEKSRS